MGCDWSSVVHAVIHSGSAVTLICTSNNQQTEQYPQDTAEVTTELHRPVSIINHWITSTVGANQEKCDIMLK